MSEKSHKERVESGYDNDAQRYDEISTRNMLANLGILLTDLKIPESPTVLDVGCGTGISTFEVTAVGEAFSCVAVMTRPCRPGMTPLTGCAPTPTSPV